MGYSLIGYAASLPATVGNANVRGLVYTLGCLKIDLPDSPEQRRGFTSLNNYHLTITKSNAGNDYTPKQLSMKVYSYSD